MEYQRGGKQKEAYDVSEVTYVSCPLCQTGRYKEIYKERNALGIVRCLSCGLVYVNPRLKEPEKIYWGDEGKYFEEARLIFEGKLKHHRDPNYLADLRLIHKYKPSGNFLDVGTNMGFFLRNAKVGKWNLYGVEPSPSLSDMARKYFGLNIKTAFLENASFESDFFDVVTMTDVFEHIANPEAILRETCKILKSDGILFIKVPNALFNLLKLKIIGLTGKLKNYDIFDSYEHVVHYSQKTLNLILEKNGFKVIKFAIAKPVQVPVWHKVVGHYYMYRTPWVLDPVRQTMRNIFYLLSLLEFKLRFNRIGYLAPNIVAIAKKAA